MKEQGLEKSSTGSRPSRSRQGDASSEKPTVVQAPLDLLAHERSPRTLPKSSLHDVLLELEQELEGATDACTRRSDAPHLDGLPQFTNTSRPPDAEHQDDALSANAERHQDTERAIALEQLADSDYPRGEEPSADGLRSVNARSPIQAERLPDEERLPDGRLRRESAPRADDTPRDGERHGSEPRRDGAAPSARWRVSSGLSESFAGLPEDDELGTRLESDELSHIGQLIDNRYLVEALIARGGMGVVYRCRHQVIGKRFAVKIIRSNMAHLSDAPRRFLIEAKAASAIGNEHIIDIVDYGTLADGSAYLVMELLEGMPLADLIARHETLPTRRIVKIAMQVCEGLRAAHEAGIVHRDLKPENIFLVSRRSGDFVKILDFGIAKMSMPGEPMTKKGLIVGTPHYMSPEQAAGLPVDPRGDIYSLGVILYELASGRVPFDASHYMAVLAKHMTTPPPPFGTLGLDIELEPEFEAVVQRCLAKRPEERFQSMAELQTSLERLHRRLPPTAPLARGRLPSVDLLTTPPPPPRETLRQSGSSLPAAAGRSLLAPPKRRELGVALLAVVVLGVSLLSVWRMHGPEREVSRSAGRAGAEPPSVAPGSKRPWEGPASTRRALEPAPAAVPSEPTPGALGSPPGPPPARAAEAAAASAPASEAESREPLTVVELTPGKSVEIETRTRLSLRLTEETRALAEGLPPERSHAAPGSPAAKARRAEAARTRRGATARKAAPPRGRLGARSESDPRAEEQAPKDNGLINPWPTPR